jgi:hypothetical protein
MHSQTRRSFAIVLLICVVSFASDSWGQIDHQVIPDTSGIWNPDAYRGLLLAMTVGQIGVAFWEGGQTRIGNIAWRGIDSEIIATVTTWRRPGISNGSR